MSTAPIVPEQLVRQRERVTINQSLTQLSASQTLFRTADEAFVKEG